MKVELRGGRAVIEGIRKADIATKDGAADGVRKATADLADDVRQHTPMRTGKARQSVTFRVSPKGRVGKVTYRYLKRAAFYMRYVLLGTPPHEIGLKYKTERGLKRAQTLAQKRAARTGKTVAPQVTRKRALAFKWNGQVIFRKAVLKHPGVKKNPILTDRLKANQSRIFHTIAASVARRLRTVSPITER